MSKQTKKTLIEEALLDIELLKESLKNNTEDIFRSVMKEEIEGIVESALTEDDYEEEDIDMGDDSEDIDSVDVSTDVEDTDVEVDGDVDVIVPDEETVTDVEPEMDDMDYSGDELDLTSASDEEVIKAYKKLSNTDEIEVVGDEVTIKDSDSGNEYVIKMGGDAPSSEPEPEQTDIDTVDGAEETMYEITLSEEIMKDGEIAKSNAHGDYPTDTSTPKEIVDADASLDSDTSGDNLDGGFVEDEATSGDAHDTHVMESNTNDVDEVNTSTTNSTEEISETEENLEEAIPKGAAEAKRQPGRNTPIKGAGAKENTPVAVKENIQVYKEAINGYKNLKQENKQIKEAFTQLREHLKGALLYNQNLTHIVKLFTENTTTKKEKGDIISKFDNVKTVEESANLFENYKKDLKGKTVMVESKIESKTFGSGSSSKLIEKTAFQNGNSRIINLMERVEGKKLK